MDQTVVSTIMIVGDDSDFSYLMQRYVRQGGYQMVITALDDSALALILQENPVAIVLEADIPEALFRAGGDRV